MFKQHSSSSATDWPLWFCFWLMAVAPFLSLYRVGPLSSFFLEAGALLAALVLVLLSAFYGRLNVRLPAAGLYFLLLASGLWLQARLMGLVYPGFSDLAVWTFVILALTAWACRGWVAALGQERVVAVLAWVLLLGALLQAVVALMQFTGLASWEPLRGVVAYRGLREVSGQLGQRNHLGHYLMWGVLAAAYLWSQRRLQGWLGCLAVLALTAVLALVNSRTIFTYVLAVALLLPLWRWRAGASARRMVWITAFALLMTVLMQFALNAALGWFTDVQYDTALDRVEASGFAMSARDIEWRKAWQIFLAAPLWGHGWGSYALQGFLTHPFPQQVYSNNQLNVLFTHSHNIVLQLLAETGIAGTALAGLGYLAAIGRLFRRPAGDASLVLLAMMTVSLCHSLLEYPLWYVYFLVPFALMMSLSPADVRDEAAAVDSRWQRLGGGVLALLLITGLLRLAWVYHDLTAFSVQGKNDSAATIVQKTEGLLKIAETEPLLRYYAQLSLTRRANPADPMVQPWAEEAALQALYFRPYANTYQVGLYQQRSGQAKEAAEWLQKTYEYYPYMLPLYSERIYASPYFHSLRAQVADNCRAFAQSRAETKPCTAVQP